MSKTKFLNLCLILTSFIGYLEWGGEQSTFLIMAEMDVIKGVFSDFSSVAHPFTLIPLLGQLLLLFTLFQKKVNRLLTYIGMSCLGLLLGLMLFIGLIELNVKILSSTLPFLITAVMVIVNFKKVSHDL